jgi:hypothetical protein
LGNLGLALAELRRYDEVQSIWRIAVEAFADSGDKDNAALIRQWIDDLPRSETP